MEISPRAPPARPRATKHVYAKAPPSSAPRRTGCHAPSPSRSTGSTCRRGQRWCAEGDCCTWLLLQLGPAKPPHPQLPCHHSFRIGEHTPLETWPGVTPAPSPAILPPPPRHHHLSTSRAASRARAWQVCREPESPVNKQTYQRTHRSKSGVALGQPTVEKGHRPEENQVSSTSLSC